MEFVIEQADLKNELGFIQGVIERKETIPVLSNALVESVGENTIRITGTDLDVTQRCDITAEIVKPGKVCLLGRKLFDIVRSFDGGKIRFRKEAETDWVEITAGRGRYRLAGLKAEEFPELPNSKAAPNSLPADVFSYFINHTSFAVTAEVSRYALSGAKLIYNGEKAIMVATDGHRLALVEKVLKGKSDERFDALIPRKALIELQKIARWIETTTTEPISFGEDQNHLYFQAGGKLLTARKLSGTFPNYEMVLPKDVENKVTFDLDQTRRAVYRLSLLSTEINKPVKITIREGEIELKAFGTDIGEGVEIVPADYDGEEITIGFNSRYLLEFFNSVTSLETAESDENTESTSTDASGSAAAPAKSGSPKTRILLEFSQPNMPTQMRIEANTGYDYRYVVMPLRL
ncbi:MAG: DNA polymerase III subunit beta [Blastocatellia bacterium]